MSTTIGERIKAARKSKRITQEQLGQSIGATGSAVALWEQNKSFPYSRNLESLSQVLGKSVSWLKGEITDEEEESGSGGLCEPQQQKQPQEEPTMLGQLSKLTDALIAQQEDTRSLIKLLGDNQRSLERQQDLFQRALDQKDFEHRRMEKQLAEMQRKLDRLEGRPSAATI